MRYSYCIFSGTMGDTINRHTYRLTLVAERRYTTHTHTPITTTTKNIDQSKMTETTMVMNICFTPISFNPSSLYNYREIVNLPSQDAWNESSVCNSSQQQSWINVYPGEPPTAQQQQSLEILSVSVTLHIKFKET